MECGDGYKLDWENALKRMPSGFKESDPHSEYYRLKSYELCKPLTEEDVLDKNFLPKALDSLRHCHRLNEWLNRCFDYTNGID